ncbi:MAG: hypothetical protein ACYS83_03775 [Planctomycetota bacterium]|jgi:hypothetical protein
MKQLLLLVGCAVILSAFAGCQTPNSGVDVVIEGGGPFPKSLAGTWKADEHGWEFVFEPDGTISSAVIDNGMVRVTPSETVATIPLKDGGKGTYKLGEWTVRYSPGDRELAVEVVVDHFHLDMKTFGLKGHSTDWFVGPVAADSETWKAERFTFPKYIALTPEPSELPVDPNHNPVATMVFRKQRKTN